MPPRNADPVFSSNHDGDVHNALEPAVTPDTIPEAKRPPMEIVWRNVILMGALHTAALYGFYCLFFAHPLTLIFTYVSYLVGALGITAGAHRLWAHRSYKARLPLKILLTLFNCVSFQNDVIEWARDHRVHHKYSETEADPHNALRGFFFAHVGWLLVRKHPEVKQKGKQIDISDLTSDPVLALQRKFYLPLVLLFCFILPTVIPWYFWGESLTISYFLALFRYAVSLNFTWFVNSAAHMWGNRPYDEEINPSENPFVTIGAVGEGYHNYHHTFPQDYSASEFGWKLNVTTMFIDTMAFFGQAYNRKKISPEAVKNRQMRTGDGSSGFGYGHSHHHSKAE